MILGLCIPSKLGTNTTLQSGMGSGNTAEHIKQWANARKTKNEKRKTQIAQLLTMG